MRRRYRSFFWPVVLIVVGLFALLVDVNAISADRLYRLTDLWPLILIVIGLELIARRALKGLAVDVAAALILIIAAGGAVAYVSVGPAIPGGTHAFDMSDQVGALSAATLHVDVGAANVTVQGNSALGSDLYRAHMEYSGSRPSVTLDKSTGDLRFSQDSFAFFGNRSLVIDLQISPAVAWSISVNSGAANETFKLSGVNVSSIDLNSGATRADITLGPPKGQVSITVNGAISTVRVHRPSGIEASAQVSGAAVSLTADGQQTRGLGSKSWQSDGFDSAADAYLIEVNGAACNVTVDTSAPPA